MNRADWRKVRERLTAAGWSKVRDSRHGQIWSDGARTIQLPQDRGTHDGRDFASQRSMLRRLGLWDE